jgi:hypothetical protein
LAFDRIEAAGDMNPSLVAGGIKVALLAATVIWSYCSDYTSHNYIVKNRRYR